MEEFQFKVDNHDVISVSSISEFPKDQALIYIFHANKIPPHIGWSESNKFYSLKATGIDLNLDTFKINHLIQKKEIPTLIVALGNLKTELRQTKKIFSNYGSRLKEGNTCLNPIDEVLFKQVRHEKIGNLLQTLLENEMNLICYGINLPKSFRGIYNYSKSDIENRILKLQ